MRPGPKVALFVAGLVLCGGIGAGLGTLVGPIDTGPSEVHGEQGHEPATSATAPAATGPSVEGGDHGHG